MKSRLSVELIEIGQTLVGEGRYGKRPIRLAQNTRAN
jgi:hypothetical protein